MNKGYFSRGSLINANNLINHSLHEMNMISDPGRSFFNVLFFLSFYLV